MNNLLYNFFIFLLKTGIETASIVNKKARLWRDGRKNFPDIKFPQKTIWMHCASLGEFEQGRPLLEALKKDYPEYPVVLSFFSPSGYEIRKDYPGADRIIYLPIDTPKNAARLISQINPAIVIWIKYEYWFNFLKEINAKGIPLLLVSGIFRKDQPFFKWYGSLWRNALSFFTHLFVQDEQSIELLDGAGMTKNVSLAGDTRFDRVIAIAEKNEKLPAIETFTGKSRVVVCGSTWEKDENIILEYAKSHPEIKIIIAPHEIKPSNLARLQQNCDNAIFYSELLKNPGIAIEKNILVIDNIGMLSSLYRYADVTYVGGGFEKSGIHNTLEAAVYGKPVIFGPNHQKFNEARVLIDNGAAIAVGKASSLKITLEKLFENQIELDKMGANSKKIVGSNSGATEKIVTYIKENRLLTS